MKNLATIVLLLSSFLSIPACARSSPPAELDAGAATIHAAAFAPTVNGPSAYWSYVNVEGQKATYTYQISQLGLLAGVNFGVLGSPSKTVKVTHVKVGPSTATAVGIQDIGFRTYSVLPGDAAFYFIIAAYAMGADGGPPATASVIWYDVAATGGTLLSALRAEQLLSVPAATFTSTGNTLVWDFCKGSPEQCPTIIGSSQAALITVASGGALAGQKCDVEIDWTEE
jgi:hypothetical protein